MRILFLSRLFSPHRGGVERHLEELSKELIKRGHEITIITEQFSNELMLEETIEGIKIHRIPYFAIGSKKMVWTWMDRHNYLIEQADLVHIHDIYWWYWPSKILQLFKPVYITFHGYEGSNLPRWQAVVQRKLAEIVSSGSICVGSYIKKWYRSSCQFVTYGAVAKVNLFAPKSKKIACVFWGRYEEDTGILNYLNSFNMIEGMKSFHVYGEGRLKKEIESLARKHSNIWVHGWKEDIGSIARNNKYAFVSQYLSILEAMLFKLIVVGVYSNPMKKDYLECHPMRDNMIIAGSAEELAEKVNELEKNPKQRKRMITRAYLWAKEQTWSKMADIYEQLWQR